MTTMGARFRTVASEFTAKVDGVETEQWEAAAPCEGWVARDVVRHLVEWVPAFLEPSAIELAAGPSVDDDPAAAWATLRDGLQAILDDPGVHERVFSHPRLGELPLDEAIGRFIHGDVLIHTWDLARATGQDERLDADEVRDMLAGVEPIAPSLEASGQYGPVVEAPAGADDQARLLALLGRRA
jgi:uncharacterized protein (TIGR03086 family)